MVFLRIKKILFFFVAVHLLSYRLYADTYYVSKSGNNFNPGTFSMPFRTIAFAVSKMAGGDIIYIRGGIYNETVSIYGAKGGTESKRTTISAYNNEAVIIDGTGLHAGAGNGLVRSFNTYTQFIGLIIRNSDQYGITLDGENAAHSIVSHCIVYNCMQTGIGEYADNCIIEFCTVYNTALANEGGTMSVGWASGITCSGNSAKPTNSCVIRHNIVYDVWGEGISTFEATHTTIEDNTTNDFYSVGIYVSDATYCLVQRNLVYRTKSMANGSQVGIGHWNEKFNPPNKNNSFINNIVFGCKRNFYHGNAMEGLLVANNTFVNSVFSECVRINDENQVSGEFSNNIIIQEDALQCIYFVKDNNVAFNNNLYNKSYDADARGAGDVIGDPKFAKTGETGAGKLSAEYFKLLSTSPAIDKGKVLTDVPDDFFGNSRGATPDIGAYEYYPDSDVKVTDITVVPSGGSPAISSDKGTLQLFAVVMPYDATDKTVTWSIINGTGAAFVTSEGVVTATAPGIVTAVATANDGSAVFGTFVITIVSTIADQIKMKIFPNPARDYFNISVQNPALVPLFLKIANLSGGIVLEDKIDMDVKELYVSINLVDGIYIVQLCSEELINDVQKLIVNN